MIVTVVHSTIALPLDELACADAVYGYSFILTNLDVSTSEQAAAVEHWYRHRTEIENIFRDTKHGAALRVTAGSTLFESHPDTAARSV